MTFAAPQPAKTGRVSRPPVYYLAGEAQERECGDYSHDTWFARVVRSESPEGTLPMIVKRIPKPVTAAVEIACGMAAREFRLNVPAPGLVVADREDLPGLEDEVPGKRFLLVGSHYQRPDALFAAAVAGHPAAEELIWEKVCGTFVASQGAAWDELIANPDRHSENVLFDGTAWWLFDHDQALAPATQYALDETHSAYRQEALAFCAAENQLAEQLSRRISGPLAAVRLQSRRIESGRRRLQTLAHYAREWKHPDAEIQHVLSLVSVVLGLIHLRLPALAEKLHQRLGQPVEEQPTLWNSPSPKA